MTHTTDRAEAMREAAKALFLLGTEHGGDPGTFDRDSAEIRASWDRVFEKAWIASPLRRPRADDDAREERLKAAEAAARVCREDAEANATRAERAEVATKAATRDRDEWKARAERAEAVAQRLGRVLAELTNPYASPIIYTQPPTPDEYDTDTVHSYAMGARAGQYLALCIVKSAVARIDAESAERDQGAVGDQAGGGK